jgi:hypothetical protein
MHLASRKLPQVALAFERFLVERGQEEIRRQLGGKTPGPKRRVSAPARARA